MTFRLTEHARLRIEERNINPLHLAAALEGQRIAIRPGGVVDYMHRRSGTVAVVNPVCNTILTVYRVGKGRGR